MTVSTGEASLIADLAPAAGLDLPPIPDAARDRILETLPTMGFIGNPLDPWGAADSATAYGAVFEALAESNAYDVLVLVHDFPYRSLPAEVATANEVTGAMLDATARATVAAARVRVAHVGRAAARDEGAARRAGERGAAAARGERGVPRDRLARALGAPSRGAPAHGPLARWVAGPRARSHGVRPRAGTHPVAHRNLASCPSARASTSCGLPACP